VGIGFGRRTPSIYSQFGFEVNLRYSSTGIRDVLVATLPEYSLPGLVRLH
jgi:hypothetical protein